MILRCESDVMTEGHVHELLGSVKIAERGCDPHNHRFALTTGEAIPFGLSHVHEVKYKTDTYEGHEHTFCGRTGTAILVGDRHVHFIQDTTDPADRHTHDFRGATILNNQIGD